MNIKQVNKLKLVHEDLLSALQDLAEMDLQVGTSQHRKRWMVQTTLAAARLRIEGLLEDGKHSSVRRSSPHEG